MDEDIDILSKPIEPWGCTSDIFPIWDKLGGLERECDYHIKQIKEKYMKLNIECINGKISNMEVAIEKNDEAELNQAKVLLEKNGYTLTPPYIPPTDSEIIARIVSENQKVGYVADWNNSSNKWYVYLGGSKCWFYTYKMWDKVLGVTYTTQSIAQQIVAELNEKRFVRVD